MRPPQQQRRHRKLELDGTGPTRPDWTPSVNPGASGAFALLGEVLLIGIVVTLTSLLIVTLPASLAAGTRHVRRYVRAENSRWADFWADFRAAFAGGAVVAASAAVLVSILALDVWLGMKGGLPGGAGVAIVGYLGLIAVGVVMLAAAAQWDKQAGWRAAIMRAFALFRGDWVGALYFAATVVFVGVCTWALPPLLIPAVGVAVLAAVSIHVRPRGDVA